MSCCSAPDICTFMKIGGSNDGKWRMKCDSCKSFVQDKWFKTEDESLDEFNKQERQFWFAQSELNPTDLIEMFEETIKDLGFKVIFNPAYEGSDMVGYIISRKKLKKKEVKEILEDCFDYYED